MSECLDFSGPMAIPLMAFDLACPNTLHFYGLPVLAGPVRDTPPFREGLLPGSGKCKRTKRLTPFAPQLCAAGEAEDTRYIASRRGEGEAAKRPDRKSSLEALPCTR